MTIYRYDRELKIMVLKTNKPRVRNGPFVIPDIDPYQVVGKEYGKWITSRSHHREYLRKHDYIEVGNERKEFGLPDD